MTVSSNDILLERFGAMSLATSTIRHTIRIRSVSVVQQDSDFTSVACREGGEGGCCQGGEARFSAKRALTFLPGASGPKIVYLRRIWKPKSEAFSLAKHAEGRARYFGSLFLTGKKEMSVTPKLILWY